MALTYDLTTIPNYEERCYEQRDDGIYLHPVTEHLIWSCVDICRAPANASRKTKHQFHKKLIELADRELDARERKAS